MKEIKIDTQKIVRPRVFTWHVHGNYLYYLTQANCDFYIPYKEDKREGYAGKSTSFPWGENVHEVRAEKVKEYEFDCILFQSDKNFLSDQYEILSKKQRMLPKIYLEHNPPRLHPTDTKHFTYDTNIFIVHVTNFNNIMWDNGKSPTTVIEHGVIIPPHVTFNGEKEKGIVVINNIKTRGRRLGFDIFEKVRQEIPLDIVGMGSEEVGGLGEIPPQELAEFISHYRFFFSPIRYTSLGYS